MTSNDRYAQASELYRALSHPVRLQVLERICEGPTSPSELSRKLGEPIGNVSYHVRVLRDGDWIVLAGERPVRGALEHIYEASGKAKSTLLMVDDVAWQQLMDSTEDLFVRARKLEDGAHRRAARNRRARRFPASMVTLLHSNQPGTEHKRSGRD